MTNTANPKRYDAVLGGQQPSLFSGFVLGGNAGKQHNADLYLKDLQPYLQNPERYNRPLFIEAEQDVAINLVKQLIRKRHELLPDDSKIVVTPPTHQLVDTWERSLPYQQSALMTAYKLLRLKPVGSTLQPIEAETWLGQYDLIVMPNAGKLRTEAWEYLVHECREKSHRVLVIGSTNEVFPGVEHPITMVEFDIKTLETRSNITDLLKESKAALEAEAWEFNFFQRRDSVRFLSPQDAAELAAEQYLKDEPMQILTATPLSAKEHNQRIRQALYGEDCKSFELGDWVITGKTEHPHRDWRITNSSEFKVVGRRMPNKIVWDLALIPINGGNRVAISTPDPFRILDVSHEKAERIRATTTPLEYAYSMPHLKSQIPRDVVAIDLDDLTLDPRSKTAPLRHWIKCLTLAKREIVAITSDRRKLKRLS